MNKLLNFLVSTRTMAVLLLVYAFAMAYATFVENDYGTPTAKAFNLRGALVRSGNVSFDY